MTEMAATKSRRPNVATFLIWILVFGALWGMSEVALGGGLKAASFPYRSGLLTGIGMGILAAAAAIWRKPLMLVGIGLVAASVNLLAIPVMHLAVSCKANSCVAVVIEAASLSLVAAALMNKTNAYVRMAGGAASAVLASAGFYLIGTHVAPCQYLWSFGNVGTFVVKEGLTWAGFAAVLVPLGYIAGEKLASRLQVAESTKRLAYYGTASAIIGSSLGISYFAIIAGL
ncbi:MAG: hypothetical protein V1767_07715 [Chloroflexota bacterium]